MSGINKCIFIGNVGADPEEFRSDNGARTTLRMACSESWKDKATGEKKERTEWIPVVAFGRLAETIGKHVKKGDKIYVEGKYQTRKWTDTQGTEKYFTEIMANQFQFVGGARQSQGAQPVDQTERRNQAEHASGQPQVQEDFDDDIPF